MVYEITRKDLNETYRVEDYQLGLELEKLFPSEALGFYKWIRLQIKNKKYFSNNKFRIVVQGYNPERSAKIVAKIELNAPKNTQSIAKDRNYNEWVVYNNKTNKFRTFNNLAAVARALNVDYSFLYTKIVSSPSFRLGKYTFSRNTMPEKNYYNDKLAEIV